MKWAEELIAKLGLEGDEAVLDIGSGDGKATAALARRVPRGEVVGIDSSEAMVARAQTAFPAEGFPRLSFLRADARSLPFEDRFDVAFSNATLHWVGEQQAVLRSVARALKRNGRFLFQMGGRGNASEVIAVVDAMLAEDRWKDFFDGFPFPWSFYGPEEYGAWCADAGFIVRRVELLPKDMRQEGKAGLAGWVRTTWMPYTEQVPAGLREPFISEIVDRYVEAHPLDNRGVVVVRMVRLEVEAAKG
jgi:trans-aconitate methyltransferase